MLVKLWVFLLISCEMFWKLLPSPPLQLSELLPVLKLPHTVNTNKIQLLSVWLARRCEAVWCFLRVLRACSALTAALPRTLSPAARLRGLSVLWCRLSSHHRSSTDGAFLKGEECCSRALLLISEVRFARWFCDPPCCWSLRTVACRTLCLPATWNRHTSKAAFPSRFDELSLEDWHWLLDDMDDDCFSIHLWPSHGNPVCSEGLPL